MVATPFAGTNFLTLQQGTVAVAAAGTPVQLWPGVKQVFDVVCVADVGGNLKGKYFDIEDSIGPVRVWFTVGGAGVAPGTPSGGRLIAVDIISDDADTVVATALNTAIDAQNEFVSTRSSATVTVTQLNKGERTPPSAGTSGFTVSLTTAGRFIQKPVAQLTLLARKALATANTGAVYYGLSSTAGANYGVLLVGESKVFEAPTGQRIDLGAIWIDAATNADAVMWTAIL